MREITEDEVRQQFLDMIRANIGYWEQLPDKNLRERLTGLAFSILVILDGCSGLPRFIVAPNPHPADKEFNRDNEENWYSENHKAGIKCDISGVLHEMFYD